LLHISVQQHVVVFLVLTNYSWTYLQFSVHTSLGSFSDSDVNLIFVNVTCNVDSDVFLINTCGIDIDVYGFDIISCNVDIDIDISVWGEIAANI